MTIVLDLPEAVTCGRLMLVLWPSALAEVDWRVGFVMAGKRGWQARLLGVRAEGGLVILWFSDTRRRADDAANDAEMCREYLRGREPELYGRLETL